MIVNYLKKIRKMIVNYSKLNKNNLIFLKPFKEKQIPNNIKTIFPNPHLLNLNQLSLR